MRSSRRAPIPIIAFLLIVLIAGCALTPGGDLPSGEPGHAQSEIPPSYHTRFPLPTLLPAPQTPTQASSPVPALDVSPTPSPAPSATAAATPTICAYPLGQIERGQIISAVLNRPFDFRVYLPPCYDPQRTGGYPTLYLLHGQSMDDSGWEMLGAGDAAGKLIANGEASPFLIVMPREDYYLQDISQSNFGRALLEDLIPWIETHYAACPQRACRAIGGLSRGAVWAMMVGLEHQVLFSAAGGHSLPSAVFSPYYLQLLWEALPEGERLRLYLDIGELDRYRAGAEEFHQRLEFLQIPHEWHLNPGTHNDAYWMSHVEDYLRWYADAW